MNVLSYVSLKGKVRNILLEKLYNEGLHILYSSNTYNEGYKIKEKQPEKLCVIRGLDEKFLPNLTGKC